MKYEKTHARQIIFSSPNPWCAMPACVCGCGAYGISWSFAGPRGFTAVSIPNPLRPPQWIPGSVPCDSENMSHIKHYLPMLLCLLLILVVFIYFVVNLKMTCYQFKITNYSLPYLWCCSLLITIRWCYQPRQFCPLAFLKKSYLQQ